MGFKNSLRNGKAEAGALTAVSSGDLMLAGTHEFFEGAGQKISRDARPFVGDAEANRVGLDYSVERDPGFWRSVQKSVAHDVGQRLFYQRCIGANHRQC